MPIRTSAGRGRLALPLVLLSLLLCVAAQDKAHVDENMAQSAVWLDEGMPATGSIQQWDDRQTFCFYENATLRVRVDALNSSLQPQFMRTFGQSEEAQAVYNFTVATLTQMQEYAWPFRSFFWAWSHLRVVIKSSNVDEMQFAFARSPGMTCRGLLKAAQSAPLLSEFEFVSDSFVRAVQTSLRFMSKVLCEQCVHGCPLECVSVGPDSCMLQLSPYHAPCVTIVGPTKPFLATETPEYPFMLTFYTVLSSVFAQNFFLGLFLFYFSETLSRSRTFHYLLGASIGICFSAVLALYFFSRQTRAATRMLPGAQLLQSIGTVVSFAVPFTSFVLMPSIYKLTAWGVNYLSYLWSCDVLLGVPHLGKIYFFFFGFLGCVLVWWNQVGATPKNPENEQDEQEIEEIGYLGDDQPLTTFQQALSRLLKLLGMVLIFYSTSSTEASLLLVLLVSLTRLFQFIGTIAYFWYHYERPGRHSKLISKAEFKKQAETETEKALKQLQKYLKENPDALDVVKEENEIRLRRFAKGRDHMDVATKESMLRARANANKSVWSYCSIQ